MGVVLLQNYSILLSSLMSESVYKFSYGVGIICIIMFLINLWYIKELLLNLRNYINIKWKLLIKIFYILIILIVSIVLIYLAIKCFIV